MFLFLDMIGVLVLLIASALVLSAYTILRPPRMSDGKAVYLLKRLSPADLGMHFEELKFTVRDEHSGKPLDLMAWGIPNPAGGERTVILVHGYADAKVGSIAWAPTWRELGYHILAIDLRAHGESEGTYTTAGVLERHDLDQVINQLHSMKPAQTGQIVLFGTSLGAIVALATAGLRDDIAALVLECPLVHFSNGVRAQVNLLGMPLPSMLPTALRIAKWISGADFDEIRPLELIQRIKSPVMVIQSGDDPFVPPEDAKLIEEAMSKRSSPGTIWHVEGVPHLLALQNDPEEYRRRIEQFLGVRSPISNASTPA